MNNNILVIGDPMIDVNINLREIGPNPEDPLCFKTKCIDNKFTLGGAANAALALRALGANVYFLAPYGSNPDFLNALEHEDIKTFYMDFPALLSNKDITIKNRFYLDNDCLLRIDSDHINNIEDDLFRKILSVVGDIDAVLISDYNKGCVSDNLVKIVRETLGDVLIVSDPKGTNLEKYVGSDFITPNVKEYNDLRIGESNFNLSRVILTSSEQGIKYMSKTLPAFNDKPVSVCGAGDIVAAVITRVMPKNPLPIQIEDTIFLANKAAAISVSHPNKYKPTLQEIIDAEFC